MTEGTATEEPKMNPATALDAATNSNGTVDLNSLVANMGQSIADAEPQPKFTCKSCRGTYYYDWNRTGEAAPTHCGYCR